MRGSWRIVLSFFRATVGIGLAFTLIYLTLSKTDAPLWTLLEESDKKYLGVMLVLPGFYIGLGACRWYLLLNVQGIHLRKTDVGRLAMIGFFFNLCIPGAVGGDVVKITHLARHTPGRRTEAVFSGLVDRLFGLMGLFILAGVMVLLQWPSLRQMDKQWLQTVSFIVACGSLGGLLGFILIECRQKLLAVRWISAAVSVIRRWLPKKIEETVEKVSKALELYRSARRIVITALILSVLVHFIISVNLFCAGTALGEDRLAFGDYVLTTQMGNAVAAIPITPAGLGTRDAVIATFFSAMGAKEEKAGAIPVMLSLSILFWGTLGAIVFSVSPRIRSPLQSELFKEKTSAATNTNGQLS